MRRSTVIVTTLSSPSSSSLTFSARPPAMTTSEAPPKASFTGRGDGFGVRFPADASGRRSTTAPGKAIFAAAARGVGTPEGDALALAIEGEKDWRHRYGVHATRLAELQSTASPDACVASCRAGLDAMHDILEFVSPGPGGPLDPATLTTSLREAMTRRPREATTPDAPRGGGFRTRTFRGDPSRSPPPGAIPNPRGPPDLTALARALAASGAAEPDVPAALDALDARADAWARDDLRGVLFVCLGGTSEMCPARCLLARGAAVACVARASSRLDALARFVESEAPAAAALHVPVRVPADEGAEDDPSSSADGGASPARKKKSPSRATAGSGSPGADLLTDAPAIRDWLSGLEPDRRLVVGSYAYLDGGDHALVAAAMDAIASSLASERANSTLAYLSSPGTAFPIPEAAWRDAERRREAEAGTWWHAPVAFASGAPSGRFRPSAREPLARAEEVVRVHDGHMVLQGPNYALAKTSQNWRAAAAEGERRRSGGTSARVSANVAPASRTESMRHVKTVAVGLEGQKHFPPLVPFDADVASALMTALLLTDVFGPGEAEAEAEAEAEGGGRGGRHPMDVFSTKAVHGGTWRCAWSVDSIARAAYVAGVLWG